MPVLSPILLLAGVNQFAEAAAVEPTGIVRLRRRRLLSADLDFLHHVGGASHADTRHHLSCWPLFGCRSRAALETLAQRWRLTRRVPKPGDVVVLAPDHPCYPGAVCIVRRVLERSVPPHDGPTKCLLATATPDEDDPAYLTYLELERWCGVSRGDTIIRWADLQQGCDEEVA